MEMTKKMEELFGSKKYIIAALHFLPLPGSPGYDRHGGMQAIIERAKQDARYLVENGVHAILFTNESDMPYVQNYSPESMVAFTSVVKEITGSINIPFGINVLIDTVAATAIAHATDASFVRGLFAGVYVTDTGLIENKGSMAYRLKANLGNQVGDKPYFFHNLSSIVGKQLVSRTAEEEALSIIKHIPVNGFTLPAECLDQYAIVKKVALEYPLVVGSGTSHENLEQLLGVCDGTIVASCLHENGKLLNPVDPHRVKSFMDIFNKVA